MLLAINAVVFGLLAYIWTKKNWGNLAIKLVFIALALANAFCWLVANGYVVKGA